MPYLASFFSCDSVAGNGTVSFFYSTDGITFTYFPWDVPQDANGTTRDPSIFYNNNDGNFYLVGSVGIAHSAPSFGLWKATELGGAWTALGPINVGIGGASPDLYAPEWFQDSDGSVHVIFAYRTISSGSFEIYEVHPTNSGFTTWSSAVVLYSDPGSWYDAFIVIKSGTYYMFAANGGAGGIQCVSASSLTGTYSSAGLSGLPSGGEGPCMIDIGGTWTLFYDTNGSLTTGQIKYQTATSSAWSAWNTAVFPTFVLPPSLSNLIFKQGTVISVPLLFNGAIPSSQAWFGPVVSQAGSLAGFAVDNNARLGFLRLGAGRLGAGPNPGSQDITFPGVAIGTHVAWFTPVVAGPLLPSKIPSQQAWFGPTINHLQTVDPAKIPTHVAWFTPVVAGPLIPTLLRGPRNWYNPTVAGPLSPSIIASRQAWFSPTVTVEQIIAPAAPIPTHASWPTTAKVSNVITISFSSVAIGSHASWPTPAVFGSPQYIVPIRGIPTNRSFPQNTVIQGGVYGALNPAIDGLQIFLGGVEVTKYTLLLESNVPSAEPSLGAGGVAQSCTIQSQTIGRWQATFKLFDSTGTIAPSLAQTVRIMDYGITLFAGCIQMVEINRELSTSSVITFEITATDKSGICDHRVVAGTPDYPAGSDVAQTILDIVTNYLAGEGITTNNVPIDGSLGTLATDEQFNFNTVTQAFDQIATDNGLLWFVDVNGDLNFCTEDTFPEAPFDLTETSGNWRNLAVSLNLLNYRNKQYVVSNLSTLPGSGTSGNNGGGQGGGSSQGVVTETYVWNFASPGVPNPGIVMQVINGVPTLVGVQVQLPIQTIQSMTVNGVNQTVFEYSNFNGQTSTGPNDHLWAYLSSTDPNGLNTIADTQAFPEILLTAGQTVVINYVPGTNNAAAQTGATIVAVTPPGAPSVGGLGTCGSGIYEAVEQVQNVATQDGLQAIANAILSRYGGVPTTIDFETDFPGLRPGQVITINIPGTYAPTAQLLITQVQGTHMSGNIGYGMSKGTVNGSFRWGIECSSILDPGNWVKWYENLIERTQNALPVYQYEEADFAIGLGGGGNIGNGLVSTNPYIVKRTGLLFDMHAAAATPPTNQDLVITFYRNGVLIPGVVTIKGGTSANTDNVFTFPATTSLYVFANPPSGPNDIITIAANYRITGANPTPALNVTAFLRWRI